MEQQINDQDISFICEANDLNEMIFRKKIEYLRKKDYKLVRFLGRGSFGLVIEAISTQNNNKVAIKIINKDIENNNQFQQEINVLKQIQNSKYLINTYECINCMPLNAYYLVTELCDCPLSKIVELNNLSQRQIYSITKQLLEGLVELKNLGIIHCDIKPDNILFNKKKNVFMYADFGVSKFFEHKNTNSFVGGTLQYMAPETMEGRHISYKVDVYSLGITLLELVWGKSIQLIEIFGMINNNFKDLLLQNSSFQDFFDNILMKMVTKSYQDRMEPSQLLSILTNNFQFDELELKTLSIKKSQPIQEIQDMQKELTSNELKSFLKKNKSYITLEQVLGGKSFLKDYKHTLLEPIGAGAFGIVFKGFEEENKRFVAIKMQLVEEEKDVIKILSEAQKTKLIRQENVIKTYDSLYDDQNELFYIISEYCSLGNLEKIIESNKQNNISKQKIKSIFKSILLGIKAIHQNKVIHGDLKPANILISQDNVVKICDFGLSVQLNNNKTHLTMQLGTYAYMSSEQVDGQVRFESDYFAAGVILCQLCGLKVCEDFKTIANIKMGIFPDFQNEPHKDLIKIGQSMMCQDYKQRANIDKILAQL